MWMYQTPLPNPLIQIVTVQNQQETIPAPVEYTIEEKIKLNVNNCNTDLQYIRADDATCLDKPVSTPTRTQSPTRTSLNDSNSYTAGYCTWYVANQLSWVPNGWGNANRWASNARSQGYTVSTTPVVGSVAQTSSGSLGHVAVVISVNGDTVTVSEMNQQGRYLVSSRTVPISAFVYIY